LLQMCCGVFDVCLAATQRSTPEGVARAVYAGVRARTSGQSGRGDSFLLRTKAQCSTDKKWMLPFDVYSNCDSKKHIAHDDAQRNQYCYIGKDLKHVVNAKRFFPLGFVEKSVPSGTHMVLLYEERNDLFEIFPLFFAKGLENNELCIVIYPDQDTKQEMEKRIAKIISIEKFVKEGRLEFIDHESFYLHEESNCKAALKIIDKKIHEKAHTNVDGIRALGDLSWISEKNFHDIICLEKDLTEKYFSKEVLLLCSYPISRLSPAELIEVIQSHMVIMYKKGGKWQISETVERTILNTQIDNLEKFTKLTVDRELKMIDLKKQIKDFEDEKRDLNSTK
jgi:hypothetical protein